MPTKEQKQEILNELEEKFRACQSVVLANYRGLDVASMTKVRRDLQKAGGEMKVAKNTLAKIAAKNVGLEGLDRFLEGPTVIAFGLTDPVGPAKVLNEATRDLNALELKGGMVDGKVIDVHEVRRLAELPSREVLLAKVLGGMQGPMYGFAGSLHGLLRKFVYALEAIRKQKEAS